MAQEVSGQSEDSLSTNKYSSLTIFNILGHLTKRFSMVHTLRLCIKTKILINNYEPAELIFDWVPN